MTARVKVDVRECVGVVCGCGCGVGVVYLCHLIACWMVLDKAVGTYSI